jgi:sugar phosphate isomerase/epimerase
VDWPAIIADYPDRVYNVHLKDHLGPQSVAIGAGEIDLPGLIAALRAVGYEGALAIEMEVTDPENLHLYVKQAYDHMVGLVGGVG